ncbi:MAG: DUF2163 domain-containing protein [Pseudomonadota bacterium]
MRDIHPDFAARLASGVTTTCLCWRLKRADGTEVGVTDHDRTLTVDGLAYEPGAGLEAGVFTSTAGLAPGQAFASGALSSEAISEADLDAGLWDGARVDVFRVDWAAPHLNVAIWSGRFSDIRRGATGFEAELVSLKADLERPLGRVYARRCDAALGDVRCGVDLADPAFEGLACDQRFETCKEVFGNALNFRGFPHMPGNDFVLAGPAANAAET